MTLWLLVEDPYDGGGGGAVISFRVGGNGGEKVGLIAEGGR